MRVKHRVSYSISYPAGRLVHTKWAPNPSNLTVILSRSLTIVRLLASCSLMTNQNEAKSIVFLHGKFINKLSMQCEYPELPSQRKLKRTKVKHSPNWLILIKSYLFPHFHIIFCRNILKFFHRIQLYRVIHKSLRDFRTRLRNNQDRHGRKEHINR